MLWYDITYPMSDNGGMMLVMISMMILSSCISSSLSSGLFVGANEDWFTGQLFDWMDTTLVGRFQGMVWYHVSTTGGRTSATGLTATGLHLPGGDD
jgi:hypothetical protein